MGACQVVRIWGLCLATHTTSGSPSCRVRHAGCEEHFAANSPCVCIIIPAMLCPYCQALLGVSCQPHISGTVWGQACASHRGTPSLSKNPVPL